MGQASGSSTARHPPPTRALLAVRGLTKAYASARAACSSRAEENLVRRSTTSASTSAAANASASLAKGSGKTTVSKLLMRAVTADAGEIVFDGQTEAG